MKGKAKRVIATVLAVVMFISVAQFTNPVSASADNLERPYRVRIQTRDIKDGGTDGNVSLIVEYSVNGDNGGGSLQKIVLNNDGNDFERNTVGEYNFTLKGVSPWMIKAIALEHSYWAGDGWTPGVVEFFAPDVDGNNLRSRFAVDFSSEGFVQNRTVERATDGAKRALHNLGGYDRWGYTEYINSASTGITERSWNGTITDNYGTYDSTMYDDAPTMSCTVSNSNINAYSFQAVTPEKHGKLTYDRAAIYKQMVANNIGEVTFNTGLSFNQRSTPRNNTFNAAVTVYRRCFDVGNGDITMSPTYRESNDNNYFNKDNRNVKITLQPNSIHCKTPDNAQKIEIANNFACKAELYSGNTTNKKLCDMNYTSSNGVITFTGTVPDEVDTGSDGVRLELTNVSSKYGGADYNLNNGGSTVSYYFSTHKVDTKAPEVSILTVESKPYLISNNYKQFHQFWMTSSEEMYVLNANGGRDQRYLNYELYKKDAKGTYSTTPSAITNYGGSGNYTKATAPVAPNQVLKDTPINLKLAQKDEGIYKLKITAYDKSNNLITKNETENVIIDNKAPEVAVDITKLPQAVDGSKSAECKFTVTDFANNYPNDPDVWSKVYYCFVKNGDVLPPVDEKTAESGTIDSTIGKWAFFEGGSDANAAQIKILKGGYFDGKLYYYGKDSCGNATVTLARDINLSNEETEDTIIYSDASYIQSSYDIKFDMTKPNITTEYYWNSKDAKEVFTQNPIQYSATDNVGSDTHIDKDGKSHLFDGTYTLHYTTTNTVSGNTNTYEKDFVFDNAHPTVLFKWLTKNTSPRESQQASIDITDISGIETATYKIVNHDGSDIVGVDQVPLVLTELPNGTMQVRVTPEFRPENSGIYKLKIYAKDKNGFAFDQLIDNSDFAIRNEKASITSLTDNITNKLNGISLIGKEGYKLNVSVSEPMKNAASCTKEQTVKYRMSVDGGINYGDWTATGIALQADANGFSGEFEIAEPMVLKEGTNNIHVQTAITDSDSTVAPTTAYVGESLAHQIICDTTAPVGEIAYSTIERTNGNVKATIKLSDEITGLYNVDFRVKDNVMNFTKISDSVYELEFENNMDCVAVITDCAGNAIEIPISVKNIDKVPPTVSMSVENAIDGSRKDADIRVLMSDGVAATVKFGLVSEGTAIEDSYKAFSDAVTFNVEEVKSEDTAVVGETNKEYIVHARGLTGTYKLAAFVTDALGNTFEKIIDSSSFTIEDAQSQIVTAECSPKITKSITTATVKFNTSVAILPVNLATGATDEENMTKAAENSSKAFSDTFTMDCSDAAEKKIYGADKCGRTYTFSFTPNAQFVTGFDISHMIYVDGIEANANEHIAFTTDNIILVVEPDSKYSAQHFITEGAEYVGFTLKEDSSIKNTDGTYAKLVFAPEKNGPVSRTIKFKSYTNEGLEADRMQDEYIALSNLDETKPEISSSYNITAPTNSDVIATVTMKDTESGVSKIEVKDENGEYQEVAVASSVNVTFTDNGKKSVRVTNGAGMQSVCELSVSNIDKTSIVEGTDYTVKYLYEDYLGKWNVVQDGKYYRSVKAVIEPVEGSSKKIIIKNNNGSFEKILTNQENQFEFIVSDTVGNTTNASVGYKLFDNEAGTITWKITPTEKTNKPVTAFVTIADKANEIAYSVVKDSKGNVYDWNVEVIGNEKSVMLPASGVYTVTAYDAAGNKWTENISVTNINTVAPEIVKEKVVYSTPPGVITAKSVNVTIGEFTKENVIITNVESVGGSTSENIIHTIGSRSIRFKKNDSVTVTFVDDYGNVGYGVLTVSNIYSESPTLKPIVQLSEDELSVKVTFEQDTNKDGVPYDLYRKLEDLFVTYAGKTYAADKAAFTMKANGKYKFMIFDAAGTVQNIMVEIKGIDDSVPKITGVSWEYNYYLQDQNLEWKLQEESQKIVPAGEAGYVVADDKYKGTNQNVTVKVETDKPTKTFGGQNNYTYSKSMLYSENGLFNFNMEAKNGTSVSYGVDIELIDKAAPIIEFTSTPELIFIEGMTESKDSDYVYDIAKFYDYKAYDIKKGKKVDLTDKVKIDFANFDPNDINNNKFDRTSPYYIYYTVYDDVGNSTTIRRTVRLVGYYDTIALVNGNMPDSSNTTSVKGNSFDILLKNFSGISYAKYESGICSMGQMKTRGTQLVERDKKYTMSNLKQGWYTLYIQTDKRDYFTLWVYVGSEA